MGDRKGLIRYTWATLAFNLGVILWGAYVRATGSGAGCGRHWPLCDGQVLPRAPHAETVIEFSHRVSSGVAFLLVLGLLLWTWRRVEPGHPARAGAAFSMTFMVTEALIGAGLVLFGLVAQDASVARAFSISIHLVNTFLLLGSLALTARWLSGDPVPALRSQGLKPWLLLIALLGLMALGASGAVTALGDTLFPARSLAEGLAAELSPAAPFLLRLRLLHPLLALLVTAYVAALAARILSRRALQGTRRWALALGVLLLLQLLAGVVNLLLLAPVWTQLLHLLLADLVWIATILFAASALRPQPPQSAGGRSLAHGRAGSDDADHDENPHDHPKPP
jgi:heme A synthase